MRSNSFALYGRIGLQRVRPTPSSACAGEEADGEGALQLADIEAYKVKDLWLELELMSPVSTAGSYSLTVILYDGGEPVQAAGSSAGVRVDSQFKVCQLLPVMGCKVLAYEKSCFAVKLRLGFQDPVSDPSKADRSC